MPSDAALYSVLPFFTASSIASNVPDSSRLFVAPSHHARIVSNSPPPPPLTHTRPRPSRLPIREVSKEGFGGGASIASKPPPLLSPSLRSLREVVLDPDPDAELESAGVMVFGVDCPLSWATGAGSSVLEGISDVEVEASLELVAEAGVDSKLGAFKGG